MENTSLVLQLCPQLIGIHQISVVAKRHAALCVTYHHRLRIGAVGDTACRIANVSNGNLTFSQSLQVILMKYLMHKAKVTMITEHAVLVHGNACCLLTAMLQSKKAIIGQHRKILLGG